MILRFLRLLPLLLAGLGFTLAMPAQTQQESADSPSRLSDEVLPLALEDHPERPEPLFEWGSPFLGRGPIAPGLPLGNGITLRPDLLVFGSLRSAVQMDHRDSSTRAEWANRLELFANYQLTGTERIVLGLRPFDGQADPFLGYLFAPSEERGFRNGFSARIETLFFEGDLTELWPGSERERGTQPGLGFAIGRQPVRLAEGLLVDDTLDALALTRNTLPTNRWSNLQLSAFLALNDVDRGRPARDGGGWLAALRAVADGERWSYEAELAGVFGGEEPDALALAFGAIRRVGGDALSLRALGRTDLEDRAQAPSSSGLLLFAEWARTPKRTDDLLYADAYLGLGSFRSLARGPDVGGTLGAVGLAFADRGIGSLPSALDNRPAKSVGAALGYQWQLSPYGREQFTLEVAGRAAFDEGQDGAALSARYARAFGRRTLITLEAAPAWRAGEGLGASLRFELQVKF